MRKLAVITAFVLLCFSAGAQDYVELSDSTVLVLHPDSLYCNMSIETDEEIYGKNIFRIMPSVEAGDSATVIVNQSPELRVAMQKRIASADYRPLQGYRVRIFFSNEQDAREKSLYAAALFGAKHRGHNIYRSFVNPNFKVTVGDFRSRSEALVLLNAVKFEFPGAFIVKETIHYSY